jgi:hypothetical protein
MIERPRIIWKNRFVTYFDIGRFLQDRLKRTCIKHQRGEPVTRSIIELGIQSNTTNKSHGQPCSTYSGSLDLIEFPSLQCFAKYGMTVQNANNDFNAVLFIARREQTFHVNEPPVLHTLLFDHTCTNYKLVLHNNR